MRIYLNPLEVKQISKTEDFIDVLLGMEKIDYGDYRVLSDLFNTIQHRNVCDIINSYTNKIQDRRATEIQQEKETILSADYNLDL